MRTQVWFGGTELTQGYVVSSLRRPLLPRDVDTLDVPGMDGVRLAGASLADYEVGMTLTATGKDAGERFAALRALAAALNKAEAAPLRISTDGDLYYMAVPSSSPNVARFVNAESAEVAFRVLDPAMYGLDQTATVAGGGSVTIDVGGTFPTLPVVDVAGATDGSGGYWRLQLEDGTYMQASAPSAIDLRFDSRTRTLWAGTTVQAMTPLADWLVLEPGEHTITMTGTGTATVRWTERWV